MIDNITRQYDSALWGLCMRRGERRSKKRQQERKSCGVMNRREKEVLRVNECVNNDMNTSRDDI